MATYDQFFPKLMVQLMDCPEPVAIDAIRDACIEFCSTSLWLTYDMAAGDIVAGTATYALSPPADTTPVVVTDAWVQGRRITPTSEELLTSWGDDWRDRNGTPFAFLQYSPTIVTLYPKPDTSITAGLKIQIATRPTQASTTVADSILEYWNETIVAGALARLYTHAGRSYSNPQAAPAQYARFMSGVNDAKAQRQRGLTRGPIRVQMRNWV